MPPRPRRAASTPRRDLDIVVFGATGFAGRLTAMYLAQHAPSGCRWGVAGRSRAKLESLRGELTVIDAALAELPLLIADVDDPTSLAQLAAATRVVITTVGPYVLYGDGLVAACAAAGTDYLDLTGEPEFVDRTFVRHHRTAVASGARLVHAAGFDSVPHDLGAYFTVAQLPEDVPITLTGYVRASGAFSGGTFHSLLTGLSRPRQNLAAARERQALDTPVDDRYARAITGRPHRDPVDGRWSLPFPSLDPQIVTRSARTLPRYGPDFRYSHFASMGGLPLLAGAAAGFGLLAGVAQIPPARRLLLKRIKPGDGPSEQKRAASWFTVTFVGDGGGRRVVTRVSGKDPGYDETAKMLAESALCLALDELPPTAGQLTTVAAMGDALLDRLRRAGIGFAVLSES